MRIRASHPNKIIFFLILSIFILFSPAYAAKSELFKDLKVDTLPNGLTIITQRNEGPQLVSINFFVNTGSINEDEKTTGISHFCEHMFYRGTGDRNNFQMKADIESYGGNFNAETGKDYTRFYVSVPSAYGVEVLKIYCDALRNASYNEDQIDQERKVILEEFTLTKENSANTMQEKLFQTAFPDHPYGRSAIGTEKSLKSFTRSDFMKYKNQWYTPENIVVIITGNFDRDKYVKFIKEYFKDMPGSGNPAPSMGYPSSPIPEPKVIVDSRPADFDDGIFAMGFKSPGIKDRKDVPAIDLLVFMLGHGKKSICKQQIVKKEKLVEDIAVDFITSKDPTLIMFYARIEPKNIDKLKVSLLNILDNIKKGNITDEEVARARNMLIKTYIFGLETSDGLADTLGFYAVMGELDFAIEYIDMVKSVTKDDLVRVTNKYFGDNYVMYAQKPVKK